MMRKPRFSSGRTKRFRMYQLSTSTREPGAMLAANRAVGLPRRVFYALHCQKNAGARDSQLSGLAEVKAVSAL
jgi:hypothetical protein